MARKRKLTKKEQRAKDLLWEEIIKDTIEEMKNDKRIKSIIEKERENT